MKGIKTSGGFARVALFRVIMASLFLGCFSDSAHENYTVGGPGSAGWDLTSNLQEWADNMEFRVGDSLVFFYTPEHDVLEVNSTDYTLCNTVNPLQTHDDDGETKIPLNEQGDRFFICGRVGYCANGLKLHVHVLPELVTNSTSPTPTEPTTSSASAPPVVSDGGHASPPPPAHVIFSSSGCGVVTTSVQTVAAVLGFFMCQPRQIVPFLFSVLLIIISIGGYVASAAST